MNYFYCNIFLRYFLFRVWWKSEKLYRVPWWGGGAPVAVAGWSDVSARPVPVKVGENESDPSPGCGRCQHSQDSKTSALAGKILMRRRDNYFHSLSSEKYFCRVRYNCAIGTEQGCIYSARSRPTSKIC